MTRSEQEVEQEGLARALLESSPDGLLLVDPDGVIVLANPSAATIFGLEHDDLVGRAVEDLVPDEIRSQHEGFRRRYSDDPASRSMGSGLRLFAQHPVGGLFPVEISLSPVVLTDAANAGEVVYTIATVRDVSEREETQARVALMQDRERIARDLHDMVIQRLFAAGMNLQAVSGSADRALVDERITTTIDDLDETIREIRSTIFHLGQPPERPPFGEQLVQLVVERSGHLGFEPEVRLAGDVDELPDYVATQLIATLREGLSNIARHAGATVARVEITTTSVEVHLTIADDGVGIPPHPKRQGGLSNMMWRAAELGGTCTVERNEPTGTRLSWRVPI